MAATTGFRTIYPALIPPGAAHVDLVMSGSNPSDPRSTVLAGTVLSSFLIDFQFRSTGAGHIRGSNIDSLSLPHTNRFLDKAALLFLRLNCVTSVYAPLWEELTGTQWTPAAPLRNPLARELAQIQIDVLVAKSLGITADELCMIYRTQFPVMSRYDLENQFDQNGRLAPKSILKIQDGQKEADRMSEFDRTWVHPQSRETYIFETPFTVLDRETELRTAYAKFANLDGFTD